MVEGHLTYMRGQDQEQDSLGRRPQFLGVLGSMAKLLQVKDFMKSLLIDLSRYKMQHSKLTVSSINCQLWNRLVLTLFRMEHHAVDPVMFLKTESSIIIW